MAATSLPAPEVGDAMTGGVGTPTNGTAGAPVNGAVANGAFAGTETDTRQTAAVTPLANANGTVPASPGVGPAGGVAYAATSNSASMGGTGVAASTRSAQTAQARGATSAGVPASGQVATGVAPVGGVRGPSVTSGA
ncbi:MAG: hypothetical protein JSR98_03100, partial [Proteobacteria bacterium]|nr:hypothetical protein [Pseudomonadota bacterium]